MPLCRNPLGTMMYWFDVPFVYFWTEENVLRFNELDAKSLLVVPGGAWHGFIFSQGCGREDQWVEVASTSEGGGSFALEYAKGLPDLITEVEVECVKATIGGRPVLLSDSVGTLDQSEVLQVDLESLTDGETIFIQISLDFAKSIAIP